MESSMLIITSATSVSSSSSDTIRCWQSKCFVSTFYYESSVKSRWMDVFVERMNGWLEYQITKLFQMPVVVVHLNYIENCIRLQEIKQESQHHKTPMVCIQRQFVISEIFGVKCILVLYTIALEGTCSAMCIDMW